MSPGVSHATFTSPHESHSPRQSWLNEAELHVFWVKGSRKGPETLEAGELARISRKDFNWRKRTPNFFLKQITASTGRKFTIKKETGKTGWLVERVE